MNFDVKHIPWVLIIVLSENPKKITPPKNPKTPRTQSAFGLLTIKHQSRPSYGIRPEVSSILEIVELGFEAFALSIIFNLSQAYL
jgi:hypothetical protein